MAQNRRSRGASGNENVTDWFTQVGRDNVVQAVTAVADRGIRSPKVTPPTIMLQRI